ncbi:MAG: Rossmann-like and DUF2520 domain-containing protein [Longimicrobiales bacterium]
MAIVGPGRVGLALGAALLHARAVESLTYYGRALEPPPHPIFDAEGGAAYRVGPHPLPPDTTILILAVPDSALPEVTTDLAHVGPAPAACAALHLSGALSGDVLSPLHARGYATGSLHPMQSVADAWSAADRLLGATFAVGGEPAAVSAARRIVTGLGGRVLVIPPVLRPVYHAAATAGSNYVVALLAFAARLLMQAGVDEAEAVPALLPLLRGALDNVEQLGLVAALTGPIARGDTDTVRLHVARLSEQDRALYCALGRETLQLARSAGLDPRRAAELEALLATI